MVGGFYIVRAGVQAASRIPFPFIILGPNLKLNPHGLVLAEQVNIALCGK